MESFKGEQNQKPGNRNVIDVFDTLDQARNKVRYMGHSLITMLDNRTIPCDDVLVGAQAIFACIDNTLQNLSSTFRNKHPTY